VVPSNLTSPITLFCARVEKRPAENIDAQSAIAKMATALRTASFFTFTIYPQKMPNHDASNCVFATLLFL
jgi:hypothetical protein